MAARPGCPCWLLVLILIPTLLVAHSAWAGSLAAFTVAQVPQARHRACLLRHRTASVTCSTCVPLHIVAARPVLTSSRSHHCPRQSAPSSTSPASRPSHNAASHHRLAPRHRNTQPQVQRSLTSSPPLRKPHPQPHLQCCTASPTLPAELTLRSARTTPRPSGLSALTLHLSFTLSSSSTTGRAGDGSKSTPPGRSGS